MTHVIQRALLVHRVCEEMFEYFSQPRNLPQITPTSLGFRVERMDSDCIHDGCEIDYRIRWLVVPMRWTTLIRDYEHNVRFVDTQKRGPYKFWWHEHRFVPVGDSTLLIDRLEYELPVGPLGELVHVLIVRRQLEHILDHRARVIDAMFGSGR